MIKRLDTLDIAATNLDEASALYQRNFAFRVEHGANTEEALITIGDARIRLRSGARAEAVLRVTGEGLAALWLEADDIDQVVAALDSAGLAHHVIRREDGRRVLEVDPQAANLVPLFIFDRRP